MGIRTSNLRPVLPGPRYLKEPVIESDSAGYPIVERQLSLIDSSTPEEDLETDDPALAQYLASADEKVRNGYLVRKRSPWYKQEQRLAPPFLCTYMGRGVDEKHPFRFIWNKSQATATNMFLLLYPINRLDIHLKSHPEAASAVHDALLSLTADDLRNGGRVYGGGLHKIEPKELANLRAQVIVDLLEEGGAPDTGFEQLALG